SSEDSRITLSGPITSASGLTTPIRFSGLGNNTSGFNLTNAANSFTGNISLFQGSLGITADSVLGNPANSLILDTFTADNGGLEFLNSGITINRPMTIASSSRIVVNGSDTATIAGNIASSGGSHTFVKAGPGTLNFSGTGT